ncbi:MAG TPA: hypothetical protein ENJ45_06090 [Phaeodactylibacter sp.]|nr:hypothetical protein [Phaeodactylibacter sp.]
MQEKEQDYLKFKQELEPYMKMMRQAKDTILEQEVSSYPIFILHKEDDLELGIPLKNYTGELLDWAIRASTLEEFVAKQVIQNEKVEDFKKIYKPSSSHLCLFVLSENGATFVFLPHS